MNIANMLIPLEVKARLKNRSYWRLRFIDGRTIDEREVDWSLAPQRGRMALQLVCPNGEIAQLGNTQDATSRLFQLKVGIRTAGAGKQTLAHVIGIIVGTDGLCRLWAWEPDPGRLVGPLTDNVRNVRYQQIGRLNFEVLGMRPD
jgi:hypothetical protein